MIKKTKGSNLLPFVVPPGTIETLIYLDKWISIKGEIKHDTANTRPPPPIESPT